MSSSCSDHNLSPSLHLHAVSNQVSLVIFDKDGTLTHCNRIFGPYIEKLVTSLKHAGMYQVLESEDGGRRQTDLDALIWETLGYDPTSRTFLVNSIVVRKTTEDIVNSLIDLQVALGSLDGEFCSVKLAPLKKFSDIGSEGNAAGTPDRDFYYRLITSSIPPLELEREHIDQCGDVKGVFKHLVASSKKVAVCTSDDRSITNLTMEMIGVAGLISAMACANDPDLAGKPKPNPAPVVKICTNLGVPPENSVMVGDSVTDIQAGLAAGCALCVFVESGGYSGADLWEQLGSQDNTETRERVVVMKSIDDLVSGLGLD
eukprot:TRINITY_DN11750_c0_g1_i1.p1 TRINITY_DN11750_c0_g1~~TRINITY_DN11750_c0_g1_i1.p1  ORF type:complete len:316 (+),score=42.55 TRINITY_DN11750_c0_g1_i1:423-1370(+)